MTIIPTEPIGSIPRNASLQQAIKDYDRQSISKKEIEKYFDSAIKETIESFIATNSPIICDGEQTKSSFITYPLEGLSNLSAEGVKIPFQDEHVRRLPVLAKAPFQYSHYAGEYLKRAKKFTSLPIKQAVISASALSLIYPESAIEGYSKEDFLKDLIAQATSDIRSCFEQNAHSVQIDFTEGRLSLKLDPSGKLLKDFIEINNAVLDNFTKQEQQKIGIHTCPGGDCNSTHSADVDYTELIPELLRIKAGNFFFQLASEKDPDKVLKTIAKHLQPHHKAYIGVINTTTNEIETPELVCKRILKAAEYIPVSQLGTTDDCGFSPFGDDIVQSRKIAFAKIEARIKGTKLAEAKLKL
jgi:5-methyltetrahydropteroyltriglutamate--homocysteine methyltransferase